MLTRCQCRDECHLGHPGGLCLLPDGERVHLATEGSPRWTYGPAPGFARTATLIQLASVPWPPEAAPRQICQLCRAAAGVHVEAPPVPLAVDASGQLHLFGAGQLGLFAEAPAAAGQVPRV